MGQKFSKKKSTKPIIEAKSETYQYSSQSEEYKYTPVKRTYTDADASTAFNQEITEKEKLEKYYNTSSELPELFTMKGKKKWCRVVDVYDGDTITILYFNDVDCKDMRKEKFRLYGIDTPELKPLKTAENREMIIDKAKEAKNYLSDLILNKTVFISFTEEEKYGRRMGTIYFSNSPYEKSINDLLVDNGYAKKYFGGKKE